MKYRFHFIVLFILASCTAIAQNDPPLLFRSPSLSRDLIAFSYAGDIWTVPRGGGEAKRITNGVGEENNPVFSPDGQQIAFSGQYDGNVDVYVVPAAGGIPKRLTYHPTRDIPVGWTPDGKRILFVSARATAVGVPRLYTVAKEGGFAEELPLPSGTTGSYSPDGKSIAYVPTLQWQIAWKRYRGGQTTPIWVVDLATSHIVHKIPRNNVNDKDPMWISGPGSGKIYFLSDRSGPVTIFSYDPNGNRVTQVVKNDGLDIKSASAGPGGIVYEQFGTLHLLDLATNQEKNVEVRLTADLPEVRSRFVNVKARIENFGLSPSGVRAVFEARGEILTVPAEKGDARNLTNTTGVAERDPAWSPDGKQICYFSDESGNYALHLRSADGKGEARKIGLGDPPSFFYSPVWSPDSKKIAYSDKRGQTWIVEADGGTPVKVDTSLRGRTTSPVWSPDSKWLAYPRDLKNYMGAAFVYEVSTRKISQITDGQSDVNSVAFDRSGKYLYFTASTDLGPRLFSFDMSSYEHPITRSAYVVILRKDLPSPLDPESDEEKVAAAAPVGSGQAAAASGSGPAAAGAGADGKTVIDLEGIGQRILALPVPARNYGQIEAAKAGILYLLETPQMRLHGSVEMPVLHRFDLSTRKVEAALAGVQAFKISANGEKLLYKQGPRFAIAGTAGPIDASKGTLNVDAMEVQIDPRVEWRQMYHEAWRIERDWFYAANYHGLDLAATEKKYAPYVEGLSSRSDLNYLFEEMLGELTVGHMFIRGGDQPEVKPVPVGLLGADYEIVNGRYRFKRVYSGENWNPDTRAPLTQPGVNVKAGEYLLAVNGRDAAATDDVYKYFEATSGKQTVLKIGPNADGTGSREVTVVPVGTEQNLRYLAWIEDNRRKVDQMSGGRVAYVHLPDTSVGGYTNFNRYYFAQVGKDAAIVDERFNGGGHAADYIIDVLKRNLFSYWTQREGADFTTPAGAIFGPKVMITNEYAGSGGDLMPWMFRKAKVGPLVGKRTWGGLVGIGGYPTLLDGGTITAPHFAFWNPEGTWDVENHGVDPDIEVEQDPEAVRAGRDPQLEKAVEVVMEALKKNPPPTHKRPAFPEYQGRRKTGDG